MCVCVCVCVCACVALCLYVCMYMCVSMLFAGVCSWLFPCTCLSVLVSVRVLFLVYVNVLFCTCHCDYLSVTGYLMRIPSDDVRKQICQTLKDFYNESQVLQDIQRELTETVVFVSSSCTLPPD